jgi:hypothetical protein
MMQMVKEVLRQYPTEWENGRRTCGNLHHRDHAVIETLRHGVVGRRVHTAIERQLHLCFFSKRSVRGDCQRTTATFTE